MMKSILKIKNLGAKKFLQSPAEEAGVHVTRDGISRQNPGTELTGVESNGTKARVPESVVSQGSGHGHEHSYQNRPTRAGHLPGIGQ